MTFKCSVPGCRTNSSSLPPPNPKISIFSFPKDEFVHQQWIKAMPKENFKSYKYSKVCELHFDPSDIVREASATCPRTGRIVTAPLSNPRLREGAVPSRFVPPPGPLVRKSDRSLKPRNKKAEKQPMDKEQKDSEKAEGNQLREMLQNDSESEKQTDAESPIVIKEEPIESPDHMQTQQIFDNLFLLEELTSSSSNSSLSNSLPSLSSPPFLFSLQPINSSSSNNSPLLISLQPSNNLQNSKSLQPSNNLQEFKSSKPSDNIQPSKSAPLLINLPSSNNLSSPSDSVPISNSKSPPLLINLQSSNNLSPPSNSPPISNSKSPPLLINLQSSSNSSPILENMPSVENVYSINLDETEGTNKLNRKRKINNVEPETNDSTTSTTKASLPSKDSKKHHRPSGASKIPRTEDAGNSTREMFQSLLNGSENNPLFGSRTRERIGDLFDVFADFIADKLREMDSDRCAFALRSILDVVFKAGQTQRQRED